MSDNTSSTDVLQPGLKRCSKCEGVERYKNGKCKVCTRAYNKAHYQANREKEKAKARAYRQANPEKVREVQSRRRARLASVKHQPYDFQAICDYYGNICLCCGRDDVKLTADHVMPIDWGGDDVGENIQPLCQPCNSSKGNYRATDYRPDKGGSLSHQLPLLPKEQNQ